MFLFNYSTLIDPLLQDIRIYVPKFSGMEKGDRVLDVCCGTGDQVFYYAKMGIEATGVDLNPEMIKVAERRKEKCGYSRRGACRNGGCPNSITTRSSRYPF